MKVLEACHRRVAAALLVLTVALLGLPTTATAAAAGTGTGGGVLAIGDLAQQGHPAKDGTRRSVPVDAGTTFSMVGVEAPVGADVAVRASADGTTWTPWTSPESIAGDGDGPDPSTDEAARVGSFSRFTDAVWVGPSRWFQVRIHGARLTDVTAHVVDPGRDPARGVTPARSRKAGGPAIVSRAGWGADESLLNGSPSYASSVRFGVVHHTVSQNNYTAAEAASVVRGIYRYHTEVLGWNDVGYNLLVDRFGTIYEGRAGGIDKGVIGAHAQGFNTGSFGVSLIGDFSTVAPSQAAFDALASVIGWKAGIHGIDTTASVTVTSGGSNKYPAGQQVTMPAIVGHRDVGQTECPGNGIYNSLGDLRSRARSGTVVTPPPPPPPAPPPVAPPPPVSPPVGQTTFDDIAGSTHATSINRLAATGAVAGCADRRYCPDSVITRGQAASLVVRASVRYAPSGSARFGDVSPANVHAGAIAALADAGVIKGFPDGTFRPDAPLTREQMAVLLQRALRLGLVWGVRFADVPYEDVTFRPRINALAAAGVTGGCGGDLFCPHDPASRAQMASFVSRALDAGL